MGKHTVLITGEGRPSLARNILDIANTAIEQRRAVEGEPSTDVTDMMNNHLSRVSGLSRKEIKDLKFSEVYGMCRGAIVDMISEQAAQIMTMRFVRQFPAVARNAKLRKSR